jgi:hypothetical protein
VDFNAHRISPAVSLESEENLTPVRRLFPWRGHRRHLSAAHIAEEGAKVRCEEKKQTKVETTKVGTAKVATPADCGLLYPQPVTEKNGAKSKRRTGKPEAKRRKTPYLPFDDKAFGKRCPPKPLETQNSRSLLADLPFEGDELKSLREFKFPADNGSEEKLTYASAAGHEEKTPLTGAIDRSSPNSEYRRDSGYGPMDMGPMDTGKRSSTTFYDEKVEKGLYAILAYDFAQQDTTF